MENIEEVAARSKAENVQLHNNEESITSGLVAAAFWYVETVVTYYKQLNCKHMYSNFTLF